jgi:hypothetical protein
MQYDREMIEVDNETVVGFIKHGDKYFEYLAPFFVLDFPELKSEDLDELRLWADETAPMIHKTEYEYEFPIAYWDSQFLSEIKAPESIRPIFRALVKYGKSFNKDLSEDKRMIPYLKIWFPSP